MFWANFTKNRVQFARVDSLQRLHAATVDPDITLAEIADSGEELLMEMGPRPTRAQLRTITDYYAIVDDIQKIGLYARDQNGAIRGLRFCVGPTRAVVANMVSSRLLNDPRITKKRAEAGRRLVVATEDKHPASCAASYLYLNGGSIVDAWHVITEIGDIRSAVAAASREGDMSAASIASHLHILRGVPEMCRVLTRTSIRAANKYLACVKQGTVFEPETIADHLVGAVCGVADNSTMEDGTYRRMIQDKFDNPATGIAAASAAALMLIVTTWASREYREELFDDNVFHIGLPQQSYKQLTRFRQLCDAE